MVLKRSLFILLVIFAACFALYAPVLNTPFIHWDDYGHLVENPFVHQLSFKSIVSIFQQTINKTYIPLTIFSFALEHHFFGDNAFYYHLNNLFLHLAVTGLIFLWSRRLGLSIWAGGAGALIFALHPMRVESVAWVTERKDVLYAFFYLLSLLCYWQYYSKESRAAYWFSVVFGFLSILAKPMALSLPLILWLCDWYWKRKGDRWIILDKIPYFLAILPIAWITYVLHDPTPMAKSGLAVSVWSFSFYLQKFLWPYPVLAVYQVPLPIGWANPEFLKAAVIFVLFWTSVVVFRKDRLWIFACFYFLFSIFFLLRFNPERELTLVANRFMYLPSLGFCLFLGYAFERGWLIMAHKGKLLKIVAAGAFTSIVLLLSLQTARQVYLWSWEEKLWQEVLRYHENPVAHASLGDYYMFEKKYPDAQREYLKSIALAPKYFKARNNLGVTFSDQGQYAKAIEVYSQIIDLKLEFDAGVYNNRGFAYLRNGQSDLAKQDFDKALFLNKDLVNAYVNRARIFFEAQDYAASLRDLESALTIDPGNVPAQKNRKLVLEAMGSSLN